MHLSLLIFFFLAMFPLNATIWYSEPVVGGGVKISAPTGSNEKLELLFERLRGFTKELLESEKSLEKASHPFVQFQNLVLDGILNIPFSPYTTRHATLAAEKVSNYLREGANQRTLVIYKPDMNMLRDLSFLLQLKDRGYAFNKIILIQPLFRDLIQAALKMGKPDGFDPYTMILSSTASRVKKDSILVDAVIIDIVLRAIATFSDKPFELTIFAHEANYAAACKDDESFQADLISDSASPNSFCSSTKIHNPEMAMLMISSLKSKGILVEWPLLIVTKNFILEGLAPSGVRTPIRIHLQHKKQQSLWAKRLRAAF